MKRESQKLATRCLLVAALVATVPHIKSSLFAQSVQILDPVRGTCIDEAHPNSSYSPSSVMRMENHCSMCSRQYAAFVKWNCASIPTAAVVTGVALYYSLESATVRTLTLASQAYDCLETWNHRITWNRQHPNHDANNPKVRAWALRPLLAEGHQPRTARSPADDERTGAAFGRPFNCPRSGRVV
jgi:hypothetical protein